MTERWQYCPRCNAKYLYFFNVSVELEMSEHKVRVCLRCAKEILDFAMTEKKEEQI